MAAEQISPTGKASPSMPQAPASGSLLRALRSRNYRLFVTGQSVSLIGFWMQRIAMSWLVYRLTDSPVALGIVDFVGQVPILLSLYTGVLLEKWDLRKTVFVCQFLSMCQAFILAALTLTGRVQYWHVVVLSCFMGFINAFELPARQSFVIFMVDDKQDLGNAIGLNSSIFNLARLLGPTLGGITIATVGEGICFLLNGVSYLATLVAIALMRLTRKPIAKPDEEDGVRQSKMADFREGWRYVTTFEPIRDILLALALLSIFGLPYLILLPVFAREILHGGPKTLGFLLTASGVGALTGSIMIALRKTPVGLSRVVAYTLTGFGCATGAFALSRWFPLSLPLMAFVGFAMVVTLVSCNTLVQTLVDDDKRNRVMGIYIFALNGMGPAGSLLLGWLASIIGAPLALASGSAICIVTGIVFWRRLPRLWTQAVPIYRAKGLLPQEDAFENAPSAGAEPASASTSTT
jgi:MFS family permease